MGNCPFCGGEIDEDLERFGGPCPHCFGHIPGEEAATDPGEEVKAQQRAEDARRRKRQQQIPVIAAALATAVVLLGVYLNLQPPPMEEPLEFGSNDLLFEIELAALDTDAAWAEELAAREAAEKAAQEAKRRPTKARSRPAAGGVTAEATEAPPPAEREPAVDDLGLVVQSRRRGPILADRGDIKAAFQEVFRQRAGRLEICLKKARQVSPDLAGSWVFSIVVDKAGAFTEVEVEGRQAQDAGFEACLVEEVSRWRLGGELEKPWPVSFPISFNR